MPETHHRKLAAILFADIVGYTHLMQQDEHRAKEQLEKFRQVLKEEVHSFNGQIVHFYGDGCLAIFENPVRAAGCASTIQQHFVSAPVVPVRIGLHSGTINIDREHVYGNAVNITSRIESLGIPGSILLSKRIRDELRNQPEFLMVSLGQFEFKNVEEPMEVFALANEGLLVPKRTEIEGKLKPKSKRNLPILLGLMAVVLSAGGWLFWTQNNKSPLLPAAILDSRIAAIPFENKTNDKQFDMLGDMAADWIVQALMNLNDYKVVSSETVRQHLPALSAETDDWDAFRKRTGAEKIIRGSFYSSGKELIFQTQILDTQTGEIEFAFPEIIGAASCEPREYLFRCDERKSP